MDPLAEKFYGMSPYSMFANNPVLFVDPTGMEFTESAWKWVNRLIADINNRQASNNAKITEKKAQLDAGGLSSKEEKRLNRQIGRLGGQNTALEGVRGEIGTMAASEQVYNVIESSSQNESGPIPGTGTEIAYTSFNSNTGNIDFTIAPGAGLNMFAHELLHGYQFDQGLISLGAPGATGGRFLLDKTDEMAGYQRQGMFGTTEYTLPDRYKELPEGPVSIHNFSYQGVSMSDLVKNQNTFQLRALSRIMNQAYRVNMGGKWQTITK